MHTSGRTRPYLARTLAVAGALAIGASACSGGIPSSASPGTTTGTTAPPAGPLARYAAYTSQTHDDPTHWVCRPEADDICKSSLDTTVVAADGTLTVEKFEPAADPPVDCFYVYPTISQDQTQFSDWSASPDEEGWVTLNQAARLRSTCRVFAPVYRQMTLRQLTTRFGGPPAEPGEAADPYADVLDAFRTYMAKDNNGRPFVLVSHSQGSSTLQRLVTEEIDPNADVRERLLAAFLAGWTLEVPKGADVGGQFKNIPLCRTAGQRGCVFAWSSYRSVTTPPAGAFFGRARNPDRVAACTTPATLQDGRPAVLRSYFPADSSRSILAAQNGGAGATPWVDPAKGTVSTPFVSVPGLVTGTCTMGDGIHYLSVATDGDPDDPRADNIGGDLSPEWGQHLNDVNLVMGDIVAWVQDVAGRR